MKLAEALSIRADLQRKIKQLKERLKDSSKVQEGDSPAEEVNTLYAELTDCLSQLEKLIFRINQTNMQTVSNEQTLTEMIARKDVLSMHISVMREVLSHVTNSDRWGRNEIKTVRLIDVAKWRQEMDRFAKELRELDMNIQSLNWSVDLI